MAVAMSHVCQGCGLELARVRAEREPHYGLWVVICPRCTAAVARGRDAVVTGYRRFRRLRRSLRALVMNLVLGLLLLLVIVGVSASLGRELRQMAATPWHAAGTLVGLWDDGNLREWVLEDALLSIVGGAAASVAAMAWLTFGLRHLSWKAWVGWAVLVLAVVNAEVIVIFIGLLYGRLIDDPLMTPLPGSKEVQYRTLLAASALAVGILGIPVGRGALAMNEGLQRWRMARYRDRRRRLERGHGG